MHPTPQQHYEENSDKERLNEDADEVRLEDPDEVVRVVEEDGANREDDDYGLLWDGGGSVYVLYPVEEEDGREHHY